MVRIRILPIACAIVLLILSQVVSADDAVNIRTNYHQLSVSSQGRIGAYTPGGMVTYFSSGMNFLRDGSLILGTSREDLSWAIYRDSGTAPSDTNPYHLMLPYSDIVYDTTSSSLYRFATGKGVNFDSTLEFTVTYYARKLPAIYRMTYYIARFALYKGTNDPTGAKTNLTVAFAADWDIPSTNAPANYSDYDLQRQAVIALGSQSGYGSDFYGGVGVFREDNVAIPGGMSLKSAAYVDPLGTFQVDSLWNRMESLHGYELSSTEEDITDVMVVGRDLVIDGAANDTFYFDIVVASDDAGGSGYFFASAYYYICGNIAFGCPACVCTHCGDANGNNAVSISDAVYLIQYIFRGGPEPVIYCRGDITHDAMITISDVVKIINYIFAGGGPPVCSGGYPR